jgi:RNA polymerase sigma factor (sigma-70 family)
VTEEEELAAQFEIQRPYLHGIAFRMLGSHAEADDAVQEAWLRLARTDAGSIEDLRGWLTTVTGRICLDALRRRGLRGEQPLELHVGMPGWDTAADSGIDPEEQALLADSVGLALYVVMDALTPAERVSFVLHDIFDIPFDTIAAILGRSTPAAKMLGSRARGRLRLGTPPGRYPCRSPGRHQRVLGRSRHRRHRRTAGRARPRRRAAGTRDPGDRRHPRRRPDCRPGDQVRASERAGTPGTRGRHPGRSRYRRWTTGHRHGLHG